MSTNHTPNFNLSQWEETDKVLRTDFNADNAKIDAALFCHPSAELIAKVTVEEEMDILDIDISKLGWSRYMALALMTDSTESTGYRISIGGGSERTVYMYRNSSGPYALIELCHFPKASHMAMLLPVFYDGSHAGSVVCFGSGEAEGGFGFLGGGGGSNPLNLCKRITVRRCEGSFQPGDRAVLWGIK